MIYAQLSKLYYLIKEYKEYFQTIKQGLEPFDFKPYKFYYTDCKIGIQYYTYIDKLARIDYSYIFSNSPMNLSKYDFTQLEIST